MYGSSDMECTRQNFLSFWTIFCPFTPLTTQKNQNFKKIKKLPEDIIISQMCTINANHMMHGSWDMERDGQNFLSFWAIFCTFISLTTQKIKILKKIKTPPGDIINFHMCTINENHMMYGSWDMECVTDKIFFIFDCFLPFYPPHNLKNQNFENMKKKPKYIINLHMCTINDNYNDV